MHARNGDVLVRWSDGTADRMTLGATGITGPLTDAEKDDWAVLLRAELGARRAAEAFKGAHFLHLHGAVRDAIETAVADNGA